MKVLSELKKSTKAGISVWTFCYVKDTDTYFAVGGEHMKTIVATDKFHLRQIYDNFVNYGYATKLAKKQVWIDDPWTSSLPVPMQQELELLA